MIKKICWPSFWISKFYEPPGCGTNLSAKEDLCRGPGLRSPNSNIKILVGFPQRKEERGKTKRDGAACTE
jgi:hypothetical protein